VPFHCAVLREACFLQSAPWVRAKALQLDDVLRPSLAQLLWILGRFAGRRPFKAQSLVYLSTGVVALPSDAPAAQTPRGAVQASQACVLLIWGAETTHRELHVLELGIQAKAIPKRPQLARPWVLYAYLCAKLVRGPSR
jgi:hypothetical protein